MVRAAQILTLVESQLKGLGTLVGERGRPYADLYRRQFSYSEVRAIVQKA